MAADWRVVVGLFVGGVALTLARRWQNTDATAGTGVAFGTVVIVAIYLAGTC